MAQISTIFRDQNKHLQRKGAVRYGKTSSY